MDGVTAKDYYLYLLEANHDREELEQRAGEKMNRGKYAYPIKRFKLDIRLQNAHEIGHENKNCILPPGA
ncbi:hypothetical protein [Oscillibacter sp.]|uniref:hypothetical protein n=1 Tax=Oscillibacter sp. TaxID=1945593 RepID=UPI00289A9E51|nr:hypothetical protein [Oscillibacter sp.]